jgi:hypothetical protein
LNILLIYPKFPDTFWSFSSALRFVGKKAAFPPLGLITVAALLPEQFQKRLVDLNVEELTDDDLEWADMAFISAMAVQRVSTVGIIARCIASNLIIAELGRIYDTGWRGNIFFVDDNFIGNKGYLKTHLLPALIEWRQDKKGWVFSRKPPLISPTILNSWP